MDSFVANDTLLGDTENLSPTPTTALRTTVIGEHQFGSMDVDKDFQSKDSPQDNQVMILSGPNSSGKSIYLKQVCS